MKKFLMMVAVIVVTAASVNAQNKVEDLRHEIGVTYGLGASLVGDGIGNGLSNGIFDSLMGRRWVNQKDFGTLSVEYFYHLNDPRAALGAIVCYSQTGEDVEDIDMKIVGSRMRKYFTLMPSFKYYWVNKDYFGTYSKAALGVTYLNYNEEANGGASSSDSNLYFAWQASLIGIEAGIPNLRAFLEVGAGEQGVIYFGGIKVKF